MAKDSYLFSKADTKTSASTTPKTATVDFIRQFARTCVTLNGCAIGTMMLN